MAREKLLTTLDQIPFVADAAERDSVYAAPTVNQRVQNAAAQVVERWTGAAWVVDPPGYAWLDGEIALAVAAGVAEADLVARWPVCDARRYGSDPTGVVSSTPAFRAMMAVRNSGADAQPYVHDGNYLVTGTALCTRFGTHLKMGGVYGTTFYCNFDHTDASNRTAGVGSVKGISGVAHFFTRTQTRRLFRGDRIVVGSGHYILTGNIVDAPDAISTAGKYFTTSGGIATFNAAMTEFIANGADLSTTGDGGLGAAAGYYVSLMTDSTHCTLRRKDTGALIGDTSSNATFTLNRATATIAAATSESTTFNAGTFYRPDTDVWRFEDADQAEAIAYCTVDDATYRGGTYSPRVEETINQKVAVHFVDGSRCRVLNLHAAGSPSTGWIGNGCNGAHRSVLTPSIGLRTTGREMLMVDNLNAYTNRPVHFRALTGAEYFSSDQYSLGKFLLGVQTSHTGIISMSATATGFHRASGSFITDGFYVGQEIFASGFGPSSGVHTITALTATDIDCTGCSVEAEIAGCSLLQTNAEYGIRFDTSAQGGTTTIDTVASNGGWGAIYHEGAGIGGAYGTVNIAHLRFEQPALPIGADHRTIHWAADVNGFLVHASDLGGPGNVGEDAPMAAYLRNVQNATFLGTQYSGGSGYSGTLIRGLGAVECTAGAATFKTSQLWAIANGATINIDGIGAGTVECTAGSAVFSTDQTGKVVNGSTITDAAGVAHTVSAFAGTTCTLSGANITAGSSFRWQTPVVVSAFNGTTGCTLTPALTFSWTQFNREPLRWALNVDHTVQGVAMIGHTHTGISNLVEKDFVCVFGTPVTATGLPFPPTAFYYRQFASNGTTIVANGRGFTLAQIQTDGIVVDLDSGGESIDLPMMLSSGLRAGIVEVAGGFVDTGTGTVEATGAGPGFAATFSVARSSDLANGDTVLVTSGTQANRRYLVSAYAFGVDNYHCTLTALDGGGAIPAGSTFKWGFAASGIYSVDALGCRLLSGNNCAAVYTPLNISMISNGQTSVRITNDTVHPMRLVIKSSWTA